jgi:hypothetical protein
MKWETLLNPRNRKNSVDQEQSLGQTNLSKAYKRNTKYRTKKKLKQNIAKKLGSMTNNQSTSNNLIKLVNSQRK